MQELDQVKLHRKFKKHRETAKKNRRQTTSRQSKPSQQRNAACAAKVTKPMPESEQHAKG